MSGELIVINDKSVHKETSRASNKKKLTEKIVDLPNKKIGVGKTVILRKLGFLSLYDYK